MLKLINLYYKILLLKRTFKEYTRKSLNWSIKMVFLHSKEKHILAILPFFNPCWCEVNGIRIFQHKTAKITHSSSIQFWSPIANVFETLQYKIFNLKLDPQKKNLFQRTTQLYSPLQKLKREAVPNLLRYCFNNIWAPGARQVCISKCFSCFHKPDTSTVPARPPTNTCSNRLQ